MSRTFLFDIGNVLLHFDFTKAARRFAAASDAGESEVLSRISTLKNELESGALSDEEFIARSTALIGWRGTREEFVETWGDIFTENALMTPLVQRLAGEHRLILFSNTNGLHKDWFMGRYDVFRHFSGGVFSHEVRCMKPDRPFYEAAIAQFGLEPAETFYIDDLPENIATGRGMGFVVHEYASARHGELLDEVERWLGGH